MSAAGGRGIDLVVDGVIFQAKPRGGIARMFGEVLPRICELEPGARVTVSTDSGAGPVAIPAHPRIRHVRVPPVARLLRPGRVWEPFFPRAREIAHTLYLGSGKGRIWHSTYYTRPLRWRGATVVTVYDLIHERFPEQFRSAADDEFRAIKRARVAEADAVICISRTTRDDVLALYGVDPARVRVVPLAASEAFRPDPTGATRGSRPYLLYVGKREGYKNFATLLAAFAAWEGGRERELRVASTDPWSAEESAELRRLGVEGRVHLVLDADDEALRELYRGAEAFVFPSLYEGFGIPLLEAMGCGCPVVASRIPSTVEVAGEAAEYFAGSDPASLVSALERVTSGGAAERRRLGLLRAAEFSWEATAAGVLDVYRAVLGITGAKAPYRESK